MRIGRLETVWLKKWMGLKNGLKKEKKKSLQICVIGDFENVPRNFETFGELENFC